MRIFAALFICVVLLGCTTIREPRLVGKFISDKNATMAYLEESGKFTDRQLKVYSGLLGKLIIECDGESIITTLDDYTETEPLIIVESTDEYVVTEYYVLGEQVNSKVIFTDDGYWVIGGIAGPNYREKFVKLPTSR